MKKLISIADKVTNRNTKGKCLQRGIYSQSSKTADSNLKCINFKTQQAGISLEAGYIGDSDLPPPSFLEFYQLSPLASLTKKVKIKVILSTSRLEWSLNLLRQGLMFKRWFSHRTGI